MIYTMMRIANYKNTALLLFFFLLSSAVSAQKKTSQSGVLEASALQPIGRFAIAQNELELISTAVHFGFSFTGTECRLYATLQNAESHNYLQYELDGKYVKKLRIEGKNNGDAIVLTAPANGKHTVWIYKATEAQTGAVFIEKIEAKNIKALPVPKAPLIEFIGNSITCGAAADASQIACDSGVYHDHHNAYFAYGPRVARMLDANYVVSSVSGIGIYRNWNSDGPAMPQVYERTGLAFNDERRWDFATYSPAVVTIALGTNDFSKGDGKHNRLPFDSAVFVARYIDFVKLVQTKYPAAQIVLLNSPMVGGDNGILLANCMQAVKQNADTANTNAKPLKLFYFKPMQPHGCSGHPSVEDHAILANELLPFLKGLL